MSIRSSNSRWAWRKTARKYQRKAYAAVCIAIAAVILILAGVMLENYKLVFGSSIFALFGAIRAGWCYACYMFAYEKSGHTSQHDV